MSDAPSIGWSDFARERCRPGLGRSYFIGNDDELPALVEANWTLRRPGAAREDLEKVVLVPCPPERFVCATVLVDEDTT